METGDQPKQIQFLLSLSKILIKLYSVNKKTKQSMKSRKILSINNSRSCTQDLKSLSSAQQWAQILQGIDAIANKVKQISGHSQTYSSNKYPNRCEVSKSTARANTTIDLSKSKSKKKSNKKVYYRNSKQSFRNSSEKRVQRATTCSSYRKDDSRIKLYDSRVSEKKIRIEPACETKCHEVMAEMSQLKKINQNLMIKNEQLQKILHIQRSEKYKLQRQKTNEIVLRVIKQNEDDSITIPSKQPQSISIELKPNQFSKFRNQNELIRLSPPKKMKQEKPKRKILDLSKQKRDTTKIQSNESQNKHQSRPSDLKSLQTQFDRLMEISYMERNKARKRVIWDEMKTIANQLKMLRYFTQNS